MIAAINKNVTASAIKPIKLGYDPSPGAKMPAEKGNDTAAAGAETPAKPDDAAAASAESPADISDDAAAAGAEMPSDKGDDAGADATNISSDVADDTARLHCSYKRCNNKLMTKEQISCVVSSCPKKSMLPASTITCSKASLISTLGKMFFVVL
jgi:hypothetical protein